MLAVPYREEEQATQEVQGEDLSWGSSLAATAADAGISLRTGQAGMSSTCPSPAMLSRGDGGLAVIAQCCCCAPLLLVMVLNTSTTPPRALWQFVSPFPSFTHSIPARAHSQHPSSHIRLLLAEKSCGTHMAGAELGHLFIHFGLGIS